MCNRIKSAKQIRCAKTVYWDLINSNMNRDVQTGWTGYVHVAAIRMMGIVNAIQLIMSLVNVYETEFVLRRPGGPREEANTSANTSD